MVGVSDTTGPTNRLISEMSPYLVQHAHNPVDWYPWGPEALERARRHDVPIFLSIGYAACHWCHVMERESFENEITAAFMNEHFVCIKVDREERPDLDSIYMDAVQAMTGQGGWPMTVFLTPETVPFHGGTYFPPVERGGMPAFINVLQAVANTWAMRREEIRRQSGAVLTRLQSLAGLAAPLDKEGAEPLTARMLDRAGVELDARFDKVHGGWGTATKFPQPPVLELALRLAARGSDDARQMVEFTLGKMAHQGIYDQVGGGFHRYTVDRAWLVPHFEKMLYDNAQLARVYTHAWQAWDRPEYRRIALESLDYLLRDMRDPLGGFYSSEDADSEGVEGKFYVWPYDEFMRVAPEAARYYGVTPRGNWEGNTIPVATGDQPPAEARQRLLAIRSQRVRPGRDDKILTSWNGLTIGALAEAGATFERPDLVEAARIAAAFILDTLRDGEGRLLHTYKSGRVAVLGMLEDYAYLADGLLALWEATFEPRWFEATQALCSQMVDLFWDEAGGGFFSTGNDHEALLVRQKEIIESVTPSPNAVASLLLQKMAILTGNEEDARRGLEVLQVSRGVMEASPPAAPTFLGSLDFNLGHCKEVVVVAPGEGPASGGADLLLREIWNRYLPNKVVAGSPPGIDSPLLEGKTAQGDAARAFVCEGYACRAPTTDPKELGRLLEAYAGVKQA
ncbi:MAG: thioredoxin domain-containing protein [Actinomycetota bacterium]